jgi:uridine kinase
MVTHLPKHLRTDEQLFDYFKKFYNEAVVHAAMIPDIQYLESLRSKREQFVKDFQRAVDINLESGRKKNIYMYDVSHTSLHHSVSSSFGYHLSDLLSFCCCFGKKTLAIDYYKKRIKDLDETIIIEQKKYFEGSSKPRMSHVGFVTFNSTLNATLCQQALHNKNPNHIIVKPAPDPRDLRWKSIGIQLNFQLESNIFYSITQRGETY